MRVTIITVGTQGDVQPYLALALGLQAAGHQVRLATHANFEIAVRACGLDFFAMRSDSRSYLEAEAGRTWLESGRNPIAFVRRLRNCLEPLAEQALADCWNACLDADAVVHSLLALFARSIAGRLGIPSLGAYLQPVTPSRTFANLWFPRVRLGAVYNSFTHIFATEMLRQASRPLTKAWREEVMGFPVASFLSKPWEAPKHRHPTMYGYSPIVFPKPADWDDWVHVTGYWFLNTVPGWQPPADLVDFLGSGPPPVYIGFGSVSTRNPEEMTEIVLKALARSKLRGILMSGWGSLSNRDLPEYVFSAGSVPHDWLFPQTAAVVHHGGAGTTAEGLRAGVPSIIVPFFGDQPFWAEQVAKLRIGPPPIPRKRLSAEALAHALTAAVEDEDMRKRAAIVSQRIRVEDGVGKALEVFEFYTAHRLRESSRPLNLEVLD